jgi:serralysin
MSKGFAGEYWNAPDSIAENLKSVMSTFSYYADLKFNYLGYFENPTLAAQAGSEINLSVDGVGKYFSSSSVWAFGLFPNAAYNTSFYQGAAGDVYLNSLSEANNLQSYSPGSQGGFLMLHEIGHTLGLKHPHDDGGTGRPTFSNLGISSLDLDIATIMSYNDNGSWNNFSWDPASPMPLDVIALQYLYGKNPVTNSGNSTHSLINDGFYKTVWDASGVDTLDASASAHAWYIELPEATLSTLVDTKVGFAIPTVDLNASIPTTITWLAGDFENIVGSAFNDSVIGNRFDNLINGGLGADTLDGGVGNDILSGNSGVDTLIGGAGNDTYLVNVTATGALEDSIVETSTTDIDTLKLSGLSTNTAAVTVILASTLENLDASGTGSSLLNLAGNALANTLTGNAAANSLDGGLGNDSLDGGVGDDTLQGGAGVDWLMGGVGNDSLFGGDGIDTALFSSDRSDCALTKVEAGWMLRSAIDASDQIEAVERLKFADTSVALDTEGTNSAGGVFRIFTLAYDRVPDLLSLGYWISMIDSGGFGALEIASVLSESAEFKLLYGDSNLGIINSLFENMLGRPANVGELVYYSDQINSGSKTIGGLLAEFADSDANRAQVAELIGFGIDYLPWIE